MQLTGHAKLRADERTRMLTEDIISLLEAEAFVELGTFEELRYLLFYSPPDRACKIAVVSKDGHVLVSIWESSFVLPITTKVTPYLESQAQEATRAFLARRIFGRSPEEVLYRAEIEVLERDKTVYEHQCGLVSGDKIYSSHKIVLEFRDVLATIATIVDEQKTRCVRYILRLYNPQTSKEVRQFKIRHNALKAILASPLPQSQRM